MASFKVTGIDGVERNLYRLAERYPRAAAKIVNEIAETTMTAAKEMTPVDFGVLKASGHVSRYATWRNLAADLSFGTEYAVPVHEHLSEHSPHSWVVAEASGAGVHFSPAGTGPKFLERAVLKAAQTFARDVRDGIDEMIQGDM